MRLYSVHYTSVGSSTNASSCNYSCTSSWWWVVSAAETCRAIYRSIINWIQSHLVGQLFNLIHDARTHEYKIYIIMLSIVTDVEFLVARITDGVDSLSVTKTATRINLVLIYATRPWLNLNWKGGPWHQHSFFHYWCWDNWKGYVVKHSYVN